MNGYSSVREYVRATFGTGPAAYAAFRAEEREERKREREEERERGRVRSRRAFRTITESRVERGARAKSGRELCFTLHFAETLGYFD